MNLASLRNDVPIIVTAIVTVITAIASLKFDESLALALTAAGSIVAAIISYLKARKADANARHVATIAADALTNTNAKTVFVQSVTGERAVWRRELRETASSLVTLLRWSAAYQSIDWQQVLIRCSEIRLRLNPAGRAPIPMSGDKHPLDREIHSLLDNILASSASDRVNHRRYADALESAVATLLKQEWDKSKMEAIDGKLAVRAE